MIIDAESVVIDLGRKSRCFTGGAAVAVRLTATRCYFPGCQVPISGCQIDHLDAWTHPNGDRANHDNDDPDADEPESERTGGRTEPSNGGGLCGLHNRRKHTLQLQARRHPDGTIHLYWPDGTHYP